MQSILDRGHELGRTDGDKAYFANMRPDTLHVPIHQMGWDSFHPTSTTRGHLAWDGGSSIEA